MLSNEREYFLMQHHKHSHTCMKKNYRVHICKICAPWLPIRKTHILQAIDSETELTNKKFHTETFATIQQFLKSVPAEKQSLSCDEFLKELNISEELYLLAV